MSDLKQYDNLRPRLSNPQIEDLSIALQCSRHEVVLEIVLGAGQRNIYRLDPVCTTLHDACALACLCNHRIKSANQGTVLEVPTRSHGEVVFRPFMVPIAYVWINCTNTGGTEGVELRDRKLMHLVKAEAARLAEQMQALSETGGEYA